MYEKALKIKIASFGENHTSVAIATTIWGMCLTPKANERAKEMYEKALKIRLATLGENHS